MPPLTTPIRQNRLANLLIEASPVAIVLTNPEGTIEVVNHVTEAWFGYSESDLVGKSFAMLFPNDCVSDAESHQACVLSQLSQWDAGQAWEGSGRRQNGSMFPVRITLHPLVTGSGEMLLANLLDLSELDSRHEKQIESERLAAVLEMVSGLAHESRNALQRAQSCLDLLELDLSDQSELLHLTDRIRRALADLHNHYEEVKDYAAPITLKRSVTSLPQLCQSSWDQLVDVSSVPTPSLRIKSVDACARVSVDHERMRQVFRSVLQNAIQSSSASTVIDVKCRFIATAKQNPIEIKIRDHGSGLSEEVGKRLFEPFFTTKQQGTGLGLAVCRRIVEAHQGTIQAANHAGGGVEIRIALPI